MQRIFYILKFLFEMKSKLFFLLFLLSSSSFAQSIDQLKIATKKIYDANYTMDFETVAQLTYPQIVTAIGKDKLLEKLDTDYQNEAFRMRLELVTPVFIYAPIKKIANRSFVVVSYKNPVRYFFENKLNPTIAAEKVTELRKKNQTQDVTFEPKRNSFNVRRISKLIAISDETTSGYWKFYNLDDEVQRQFFDTTFDITVKKELGL